MWLFVDGASLHDVYQGTTWRTLSTRSYDSQKRDVLGGFDGISDDKLSVFALVAESAGSVCRVATHRPVAV